MTKLNSKQLATLRQILQRRYQELLEEVRDELIRSGDQNYIDLAGRVTDLGDESVADALADMNAAIVDRQIQEIREIEAALARIADSSYGDCIDCAGEIGYERLLAYPSARRCHRCQAVYEKTHSGNVSPSL